MPEPLTTFSASNTMPLNELINRLSAREEVGGVLLIGSSSRGELKPASDIDLVIVLREVPQKAFGALTYIEGRLADVMFVPVSNIELLLKAESPQDMTPDLNALARWLQSGSVSFDRESMLTRAQERLRNKDLVTGPKDSDIYRVWFSVNFNLKHNRRLLNSGNPVYLMVLDLRLLYCLSDLMTAYFLFRKLQWNGEKAAILYWEAHDREFLDTFRKCVSQPDRTAKFEHYRRLAELTTSVVGGIWDEGSTAVQFNSNVELGPDAVHKVLDFWEYLITGVRES